MVLKGQRRLLIRPGAIGDLIVSLPAMECLRTGYLEVWAASANLPLIRFADRTRAIAATGLDLLGVTESDPRLMAELAGFDSIVSWYGSGRPDFRELVRQARLPFTFLPALPLACSGTHATDYYLEQARPLGACASDGVPRIPCPTPRDNFAVIHPFSGSAKKNWPLERFRELARGLAAVLPVRWCAGPEEALEDAARFSDLYELAGWLASARLYIGSDSGITHLAAAVGTPVVALFGPTDPKVWAPRGPRVGVAATPKPGQPMESLALAEVQRVVYHTMGDLF
jgi:heptosyltransferase-2